jgi:hypothetical protein
VVAMDDTGDHGLVTALTLRHIASMFFRPRAVSGSERLSARLVGLSETDPLPILRPVCRVRRRLLDF